MAIIASTFLQRKEEVLATSLQGFLSEDKSLFLLHPKKTQTDHLVIRFLFGNRTSKFTLFLFPFSSKRRRIRWIR